MISEITQSVPWTTLTHIIYTAKNVATLRNSLRLLRYHISGPIIKMPTSATTGRRLTIVAPKKST